PSTAGLRPLARKSPPEPWFSYGTISPELLASKMSDLWYKVKGYEDKGRGLGQDRDGVQVAWVVNRVRSLSGNAR
ncbi:hypothetical protein FS837_004303, partial [Tulasnella sp. UAMH 9824]